MTAPPVDGSAARRAACSAAAASRRTRTARSAALVAAVTLLMSACGVRVNSSLRDRAAEAQLGEGGALSAGAGGGMLSGTGTGASSGTGAGNGTAVAGSASAANSGTGAANGTGGGASSSSGPGTAGGSGGGSASTKGGGTVPVTLPAGGNGGATDVGVTANSILLGNVSDLSGPVPGLFQGAVTGTQAYINYINSQGGIYGRDLKLATSDSQTSCSQTESSYSSLVSKVFAFVGSFGLYDNCGASVLSQHSNVPAVQYMLSNQGLALPNDFSVDPLTGGYPTGMFTYFKNKLGAAAVQNVGTIYSNIPSAQAQANSINAAAQSQGWKFTYTRGVGATETNFTADIVRMQSQNVKVVFVVAATAQICATLVDEANQQNWHPIFVLPVAYAQNFVQLAGGASAVEGIYGSELYSLFTSPADASAIPEVALYQQWMKRTDPNQPEDLFSMYGWAETALFVQALKAAGPKATQAGLMAALKSVHSFDDNGMVGPADPAGKVPTHCYVLWQIHSGQFQRLDTPSTGFRCDGQFYKG
ncbi:MAG TPA: ABC transporter substrate-binding protein [Acidimicrobiales bacterium]|nr:ABC transporter substrate-binding protein [Acidimicrobiales bacterium]